MKEERTWRTRKDPFEKGWSSIESLLKSVPDIEAKGVNRSATASFTTRAA